MKLDLLGDRQRTHLCGELRKSHAGQTVFLTGWVDRRRDLGNLIFLDLRDHTGVTQVVLNRELSPAAHEKAEAVRAEYVVGVEGEVALRSPETVNKQVATGEVEVKARAVLVLNEAKTPPFPIQEEIKTSEEARLRYRYLDLRRGHMQRNLRLRHRANQVVRQHLSELGFVEIETPFMTRSTPEGARDYLVPSRLHHGHFYALPQSPQLFKQLLMMAGFDRYFQIVRCFRDEDFRADRQAEFTQIDIEMAFPQRHVLFDIIERLMEKVFALVDVKVERPFPRLPYDAAMERYGSDKPHLGFSLEWKRMNLPDGAEEKLRVAQPLKAMRVPGWGMASRSQLDTLQELARENAADWFSYVKVGNSELQSPLAKIVGEQALRSMVTAAQATEGDVVLLLGLRGSGSGPGGLNRLDKASGEVRLEVARKLGLAKSGTWNFVWVVDFPMFEFDEKEKRYAAVHHPFTSPREEDLPMLETDPAAVKARAYDLVLNGQEIGGGSVRMHRRDIQQRVFKVLGLSEEQARERFGFFMEALEYGAPPHGGIALGYDRLIALMAGESNIREVIAFPKTASAVDLMCDAPSAIESPQEEELELMGAYPNLPRDAWLLAGFCDELLRLLDGEVFTNPVAADTFFQRAMGLILAKARDDARAATRLAKAGYGPQSAGLCRSLVEASINSRYIEKEPEVRGEGFLKSIFAGNRRLAGKVSLHPVPQDVKQAINEAKKVESESKWPRNIAERAYDIEKPHYAYDVVFFLLSQQLHSDVAALAGQVGLTDLTQYKIRIGRGEEWVTEALATVFIFLSQVVDVAYKAFGLSKDNLNTICKRFEEAHRSGLVPTRC